MPKLLIVSGSSKVKNRPETPIPALHRFEGGFVRVVKKYHPQLLDVDVLILSPVYGLVSADDEIGVKEPMKGSWHKFVLEDVLGNGEITDQRNSNLATLRSVLSKRHFDEIHVNVGYEVSKLIKGFEHTVPAATKITYDRGGMGKKMTQLRDWLRSNIAEG